MILRLIRRYSRRAGSRIFGYVFRTLAGPPRPIHSDPRRILVIRVDERVGNVLLTSPLLDAVVRAFPNAKVDALIAASKRHLIESTVNVIPFERRFFFKRPWTFVREMLALRRTRYDVAIDASHWHEFSASSAMLLAFTRAPLRIAHQRGDAALYANALIPPPEDPNEIRAKLALLEPLGISAPKARMSTAVGRSGPAKDRMARFLEEQGLAGKTIVGLAPGARKHDHRVPRDAFAELGRAARKFGAIPLVLWGPGEETLAEEVARTGEAVLAPPTNLDELAALMRACSAIVTNDTGPMHLAVACGAPTISLFTQADHPRWGHSEPPNLVIPYGELGKDAALARAKTHLEALLGQNVAGGGRSY
jgi:ADP-heptose:LPS heptosyltransferase